MDERDVATLVRAAAADEPGAWESLVHRFAQAIWAVARSYGLSVADASDVTQTTWLRLAEHVGDIRQPERIGGWLVTTARNESLRILRMTRRQLPMDPTWALASPADATDVDLSLLNDEQNAELRRAFDLLPFRCKVLLRMLIAEPAPSYSELSLVLDMPIGSIGPSRSRCLDRLRRGAGIGATPKKHEADTVAAGKEKV